MQKKYIVGFTSRLQGILDCNTAGLELQSCLQDSRNVINILRTRHQARMPRNASLSPVKAARMKRHKDHTEFKFIADYLRQNLWRKPNFDMVQKDRQFEAQVKKIPKLLLDEDFVRRNRSQKELKAPRRQHLYHGMTLKERTIIENQINNKTSRIMRITSREDNPPLSLRRFEDSSSAAEEIRDKAMSLMRRERRSKLEWKREWKKLREVEVIS